MKKLKLLLVLTLSISFVACDKDDPKPAPTTQEMLVGKWMMTANIREGVEQTLTDCDKLTYFKFDADGSFEAMIFAIGGTECVAGEPSIAQYTLSADSKKIIFEISGGETTIINIVSISETTLVLSGGTDVSTFTKE